MGVEEEEGEEAATGEWEGQGEGDVAEVEEEFELTAFMKPVFLLFKRHVTIFSFLQPMRKSI